MGHDPHPSTIDVTPYLRDLVARPMAIAPEWITPRMARLHAGETVFEAAIQRPEQVRPQGGAAVLPLVGPIQHREDFWSAIGFATSTETFARTLRTALADDAVKSIVIDVDSPGGDVDGVDELASLIHGARGTKPIIAVANAWMASAAYYLGSQADELVVTPTGMVGSIGVIIVHADWSRAYDLAGITTTIIRTPARKAETNPFEPLSADAQEHLQAQVDTYYGMFVDAVARGRKVSAQKVRADFGGGRMVMAAEAVRLGMADRIATLDDVLGRGTAGTSQVRGARVEDEPLITTEEPSAHQHVQAPSTEALYALVRTR
ncbi:MAG: peptidase S49 [Chloroflexi bacterium HGW-Chloroflexi-9]|nr:MAG: peptidase S49 [Chloroflexi bacterium HGW-Chloroflexi-9]